MVFITETQSSKMTHYMWFKSFKMFQSFQTYKKDGIHKRGTEVEEVIVLEDFIVLNGLNRRLLSRPLPPLCVLRASAVTPILPKRLDVIQYALLPCQLRLASRVEMDNDSGLE
jgi:hypothetical protein